MVATVFDRQRGAEAAAELGGVGEQVNGVAAGVVGRPDRVAILVVVEAEEGVSLTSRQAAELDEGLVDRKLLDEPKPVRVAVLPSALIWK